MNNIHVRIELPFLSLSLSPVSSYLLWPSIFRRLVGFPRPPLDDEYLPIAPGDGLHVWVRRRRSGKDERRRKVERRRKGKGREGEKERRNGGYMYVYNLRNTCQPTTWL